jgi:hypothetical protein
VLCERVPESSADRRVRDALSTLKKSRAAVVLIEDADVLRAALPLVGNRTRQVVLVTRATRSCRPSHLIEIGTGVITAATTGAASDPPASPSVLTTLPSLNMAPGELDGADGEETYDAEAFWLWQQVLGAQAAGRLPSDVGLRLSAVQAGDLSELSAMLLAALPTQRRATPPFERKRR